MTRRRQLNRGEVTIDNDGGSAGLAEVDIWVLALQYN
jgi:hypothetical protein